MSVSLRGRNAVLFRAALSPAGESFLKVALA